ncbi:hypothetical protein [Geotalea sp. SG265]|uniref:hypothetical protein n=1 Tax=Geotalea sp. SG265 TaxID=2922867 RepID=UPI001FB01EFF|nr:hypothetical protein [Geotalea sp. SG265]
MKRALLFSICLLAFGSAVAFGADSATSRTTQAKSAKGMIGKAKGPNAVTVGEAYRDSARLAGNVVVIRGKVVKVTAGIMDKNWVHIQDGTENNGNYDLTCTTSGELPPKGAVVTVTGRLATNRDFGAGYFYPVIVEDVTFSKK